MMIMVDDASHSVNLFLANFLQFTDRFVVVIHYVTSRKSQILDGQYPPKVVLYPPKVVHTYKAITRRSVNNITMLGHPKVCSAISTHVRSIINLIIIVCLCMLCIQIKNVSLKKRWKQMVMMKFSASMANFHQSVTNSNKFLNVFILVNVVIYIVVLL